VTPSGLGLLEAWFAAADECASNAFLFLAFIGDSRLFCFFSAA
jgi:hypothetical protein